MGACYPRHNELPTIQVFLQAPTTLNTAADTTIRLKCLLLRFCLRVWFLISLSSSNPGRLRKIIHGVGWFGAVSATNPDLVVVAHITTARYVTQRIDWIWKVPICLNLASFWSTRLGGDVQNIAISRHLTNNSALSQIGDPKAKRYQSGFKGIKFGHRAILRLESTG